jgi:hypothetical protein
MPLDDTTWVAGNDADEQAFRGATCTDPTTDLLIRARGLIERGWCRGIGAKDADGHPVGPSSAQAVAWCAGGALIAAGMPVVGGLWSQPAMRRLGEAMGGTSRDIMNFNDRQLTVEPVLAAFDRAIAMGREG